MRKEEAPHVILDTNTGKLKCLNCGETMNMPGPMPMKMTTLIGQLDAFHKSHVNCKPGDQDEPQR